MLNVQPMRENLFGRDFVCGDLHGCVDLLLQGLVALKFDPLADRVFCVGDLTGRGPKSMETLDLLDKPWFYAVRGNHETLLELFEMGVGSKQGMSKNGEGWFCELDKEAQSRIVGRLKAMPDILLVGFEGNCGFNVFHAEFLGTQAELAAGKEQYTSDWMEALHWGRSLIQDVRAEGRMTEHGLRLGPAWDQVKLARSFVGHTIVKHPTEVKNMVFVDTGAFRVYRSSTAQSKPGFLSIVEVQSLKGVAVDAQGVREISVNSPPIEQICH